MSLWTPKEGCAVSLSLSRELPFSGRLKAFRSLAWAAHTNNTHLSGTYSTELNILKFKL